LAAVATNPISVFAQNSQRPARLGWLTAQQPSSLTPYIHAMRTSLAELGYVEGRNLTIDFRYGNDDIDRVPVLAKELIDAGVDVIAAQGSAVFVLSRLKLPVPIVYCVSADPVLAGLAGSLSQPHNNMTGLTFMLFEFAAKRIELLREIIPDLKHVAVIGNSRHMGTTLEQFFSEQSAKRIGLKIDFYDTVSRSGLDQTLEIISKSAPEAISLLADGFAIQNRQMIIDFAMKRRIPVVSGWAVFAQSGALFTYGPRLTESYRRLAYYVVRVLKGAKPADLPIERPTKFEFVINMATAKALGLSVSRATLARADEVIG
jgi:putative ABC transport system substrate-binding protein